MLDTLRWPLMILLVTPTAQADAPPPARREIVRETLHGVEIADPYRWLEDQDSAETRAFVEAQEAHFREVIDALPQRKAFESALKPLFERDDLSTPQERGGRLFFTRRKAGERLPSLVMRKGHRGPDRVLVDPLDLDPAGTRSVQISALSDDGRRIAVGIRDGGADESEIRFFDVDSGREVAERLPSARHHSMVFAPDGEGAYYVLHAGQRSTVRQRRFGQPVSEDPVLFGEGLAEGTGVSIDLSPDGAWLVATVWHGSAARKSEIHVRRTDESGPFRAIVDDIDARFDPMPAPDGRLYVRSTWNAPNGRILAIDLARPARSEWREVVPQTEFALQDARLVGGRLALRYLENVKPVVRVYRVDGKLERELGAPGEWGSLGNLSGRWSSGTAFLSSSSWLEPELIERVDIASGRRERWFQAGGRLPAGFVIEQHWFTSRDGARVPLFLGRAANAKPDGKAPVLVMGYGGFSLSQLPRFSPRVAAWLLAGGSVALPALRGGAEFGEDWHEQAMGAHKQRTFDDLYAAARWLVDSGWADPARLAAWGRSNGGLLVGAALTQQPQLFRAVVCGYPLLDMLRYHQFLVARFWVTEYGSAEDSRQFRWLYDYSPYHNVRQGEKYPATLFVTGDADTRVAPLHARKMAALLQASSGSGHPVLLHYDTQMGHVGGLPAEKELADLADELAFLAWQLGMEPGSGGDIADARGSAKAKSKAKAKEKPRARLGR